MNDPVGNVRYCYTPLAAYIADTPELSLVACMGPKVSLFTTATSKNFGDLVLHPPHTGSLTLAAIRQSLAQLVEALQLFHDNKHLIVLAGVWDSWEIPKLELLQSMASSIQSSGPVMQCNNQNYYEQISHYLDQSNKCFRFNVATHIETRDQSIFSPDDEDLDSDQRENGQDSGIDSNAPSLSEHMNIHRSSVNYFVVPEALAHGCIPNAPKPYRTFSSSTTVFHIANKPSLCTTIDQAATLFGVPDLRPAICEYLQRAQADVNHDVSGVRTQGLDCQLPLDRIQIWYKLRVQQFLYHADDKVDAPQTMRLYPPSPERPHRLYDMAVISPGPDSDWPQQGIEGHVIVQLRLIFQPINTEYFATYVQRFNVTSQQGNPDGVHPGMGMHLLRWATNSRGTQVSDVVPILHI
ncbi:hypothetical protein OG21DRAFT_1479082 [Imleria badia]|nr:hypothetical protein OG21DRAFT_1479082 [Imleria badia]